MNAHRGGDRNLVDEITRAWAVWEERGAPGMYAFGLHLTPHAHHVVTGDDPHGPRWQPLAYAL
ncbi:hypothetical protein PV390_26220 [Streptomyces sp. ME02-6991-2A]|uniref:hypothetical protein n=1 Tax=Streptomyces sp. ME02-6991-2A TaxID=3028677 RepID=UPI0029A2CC2B|nr:hypothetical protein [Streptomyces sp. ME02-6991-2A]MDX3377901.1 hypothetical protein [Streptomyces sp. ME02-6991-2A]